MQIKYSSVLLALQKGIRIHYFVFFLTPDVKENRPMVYEKLTFPVLFFFSVCSGVPRLRRQRAKKYIFCTYLNVLNSYILCGRLLDYILPIVPIVE